MRAFFLFVVLLLLCAAGGYYFWVVPYGPSTAQLVTVAPGSSVAQIGDSLQRKGTVRNRYAFDLLARLERGTLKAGVYRFDRPAPMTEVYRRLRNGDVYTIALTIPEGYNIFDIAAAVEKAGLGQRDAFLAAERQDTALVRDYSPQATSLEGYLFPDTYRLAPNTPPRQILGEMVAHFRQEAATLGLSAAPPAKISSTVILASLIERETPVSDDRPMVASVFQNRLAQKKLEAEIRLLEHELTHELPLEIKKAASLGDLSENAEYHMAKQRQVFVNARLGQLKHRMSELALVNLANIPRDRAAFGSKVTVYDQSKEEKIQYKLVTSEEADVNLGLISTTSPIGRSLVGKQVGDIATVVTPNGKRELEVLELITIYEDLPE